MNNRVSSAVRWKLLERFFSVGVSLIVQIVLARILNPSDFGSLAIIMSVVNFASIFVNSGIATAIIQKKEIDEEDISTTTIMCLIIATVVTTIIFFVSPYLAKLYNNRSLLWGLRFISVILFFNAINSIQVALLSRKLNFKTLFIRSAVSVSISGLIGIILALKGAGLWALIIHSIALSVINVLVLWLGDRTKLISGFSFIKAKRIYSFSSYILFSALLSGINDILRSMIIGKKYSEADLAYYDKGYTYSNYISQIAKESVSSVLLPVFASKQSNIDVVKQYIRKSIKTLSFISFPVLIGISLVSQEAIVLVLGTKWIEVVPYLQIFCIFRLVDLLKAVDIQAYYAVGKSKMCFIYSLCCSVLNLVALFITVSYGVIHILYGLLAVEILAYFAVSAISYKLLKYSISERIEDLIKPFLSTLFMSVCVWGVGCLNIYSSFLRIVLKIITGVISYSVMECILKDSVIISLLQRRAKGGEHK